MLGPDRCRVVLGSWSWMGPASALGRFDADLTAVQPAELREAFTVPARRCAAAGAMSVVTGRLGHGSADRRDTGPEGGP